MRLWSKASRFLFSLVCTCWSTLRIQWLMIFETFLANYFKPPARISIQFSLFVCFVRLTLRFPRRRIAIVELALINFLRLRHVVHFQQRAQVNQFAVRVLMPCYPECVKRMARVADLLRPQRRFNLLRFGLSHHGGRSEQRLGLLKHLLLRRVRHVDFSL